MFDEAPNIVSSPPPEPKKNKFGIWRRLPLYFFIIGALVFGLFSYGVISSDESLADGFKKLGNEVLKSFRFLTAAGDKELDGEKEDRVNILLLGIGGAGHEGGHLTDTIILASYKPSAKKVAMLSIPRDLIVNLKPYGWRKINTANAFGETQEYGSGPKYTAAAVSDITGLPIHYYVRVDFSGFTKLIDQFGGVDVYADNLLDDYRYPIKGKELVYPLESRFEHLHVEKGWHHFDGASALKFARSRHGLGAEGTDFARGKRQQKVILALKDKIMTVKTFLQPAKIKALFDSYKENVVTSFELWEMAKLATWAQSFDNQNVINKVLDDSVNGPLVSTNFNGIFILEPKAKDFSQVKEIAQKIFDTAPNSLSSVPPKPEVVPSLNSGQEPRDEIGSNGLIKPALAANLDKPTIEVLNGTSTPGLAKEQEKGLGELGFEVVKLGNATKTDYEKTVIYDFSGDKFPLSARTLAEKYGVELTDAASANVAGTTKIISDAHFVLILGMDKKPAL